MFPDSFLANATFAALGIATAVYWLRTGMVTRGTALLTVVLVALDVAVVARFVFDDRVAWYPVALGAMQLAGAMAAGWLLLQLGRRQWSGDARRRRELFAAAFRHYLRDELGPAQALFRRVLRADPWHAAACIGLANVRWRQGQTRAALRLVQAARRLDRSRKFAGFVAEQQRRMQQPPAVRPQPAPAAPMAAAPAR